MGSGDPREGEGIISTQFLIPLLGVVVVVAAGVLFWLNHLHRVAALRARRYWIYFEGRPVGPMTHDEVLQRTSPDSFVKLGDIWVGRAEHPDFGL